MFSYSATRSNRSIEPPSDYPGAPHDAEPAKRPPLPEPPYKPFSEKLGDPYKPYAEKPQPGPPYEPYKGM